MEKEKPRGTRPEMGTPEYEEWRKRMIARRRKRLQRERRKRLIAMGVALVVVIGGISAGINSCNGKKSSVSRQDNTSASAKTENGTSAKKDSAEDTTDSKENSAAKDILAQADILAQQYNYDEAISLLKKDSSYSSSKKLQAAVKKYEETKATCTAWPLEKVTHVFYHILTKTHQKPLTEIIKKQITIRL